MKADGVPCGSPAMRGHRFCFHHHRWHEEGVILNADRATRKKPSLDVAALGNAKAIQISIMQVLRQLLAGEIDHKTASVLLYGLQTATINVRQLHTNPAITDPAITDPAMKDQIATNPQAVSTTRLEEDASRGDRFSPDSANEGGQNPHSSQKTV